MPKYRIPVCNTEYGFIDVVADNLDEAEEKAYAFDGDYFVHKNYLKIDGKIEILEENE
jgi:two-component SAPR family response regulator